MQSELKKEVKKYDTAQNFVKGIIDGNRCITGVEMSELILGYNIQDKLPKLESYTVFKKIEGKVKEFKILNFNCLLHKTPADWSITEKSTGLQLSHDKTIEGAKKIAESNINQRGIIETQKAIDSNDKAPIDDYYTCNGTENTPESKDIYYNAVNKINNDLANAGFTTRLKFEGWTGTVDLMRFTDNMLNELKWDNPKILIEFYNQNK